MNQCITRRQKGKGIEITVVIKKDCYDVYIDITPEVDISRKIVEKYYTLKLKLLNGKKTLEEPFHLQILSQKYYGNSATTNAKLVVKNEEYRFEISLSPKLYVSPNKLIEAEKKQKEKKRSKKRISTSSIKTPGLASSKITKYTQSNITRPYSGGSCTPK